VRTIPRLRFAYRVKPRTENPASSIAAFHANDSIERRIKNGEDYERRRWWMENNLRTRQESKVTCKPALPTTLLERTRVLRARNSSVGMRVRSFFSQQRSEHRTKGLNEDARFRETRTTDCGGDYTRRTSCRNSNCFVNRINKTLRGNRAFTET